MRMGAGAAQKNWEGHSLNSVCWLHCDLRVLCIPRFGSKGGRGRGAFELGSPGQCLVKPVAPQGSKRCWNPATFQAVLDSCCSALNFEKCWLSCGAKGFSAARGLAASKRSSGAGVSLVSDAAETADAGIAGGWRQAQI